jgi:formate hydrogenlyase transcriptional activator
VEAFERFGSGGQGRNQRRFEQVIGNSPALEAVLEQVERVAPTDSTVLIQGETGTGKELIARAIHNISSRCGRSFAKLNCAAIPLDLLESELFGHEKGAFTGAIAQRIGRFELADKGTLFLDEVGDIPLALQPKLLRVLQEQEFERLGSTRTHQVDVRLVAATNRDLTEMVKGGQFRIDLYYRLNVFPILLPPLRARREDIPALVTHFVEIFSRRMGRQIEHIPPETMSALSSYQWPGNIRELQNLIERAVILSNDGVLPNPLPTAGTQGVIISPAATTLRDSERTLILHTLAAVGWVLGGPTGAAAKLGLKRTTLIHKMKKLGISRPCPQSNQIERAVILSNNGVLPNALPTAGTQGAIISPAATTLRDSERTLISHTLAAAGWVLGGPTGAAAKLGMKRTTLIHKMKKLGISRPCPQSSQDVMGPALQEPELPQF